MIEEQFPAYLDRIAAGLVGEGSDCFGFDDEISRDHDWGAAFCLWLTKEDYTKVGADLQAAYDRLPVSFEGFQARKDSPLAQKRYGVLETARFFTQFTGLDHVPATLREWRAIPESFLATATNGQVFHDPLGEFTSIRNGLKAFYPEDVRLKKIAARCMTIGQSGQYNYFRCMRRREHVAAYYALAQFTDAVISLVFLLNRAYKPFYKWMHRALASLPVLGGEIHELLDQMVLERDTQAEIGNIIEIIERICGLIVIELQIQGLSDQASDFLCDHGPVVQSKITDPQLKAMHVMAE